MKNNIYVVLSMAAVLLAQGCAYSEMTYFRKHGATLPDERKDWGLCGGNFRPDGQVRPTVNAPVLKCMAEKGYRSINDYYVEQQISFVNLANPASISIESQILDQCGFRHVRDGLCQAEPYIPKPQLSRVISCMSANGYEANLPRYKAAFRIVDDVRGVSPNYCLSLTPRSGKGGVSLGGWRFE